MSNHNIVFMDNTWKLQLNFSVLNTDGSFTTDVSNLFLSPLKKYSTTADLE